jgi:hypothetical protein
MRPWKRPVTVAIAVFAIAFASCYAPRFAHALPQAAAAATHEHGGRAMPCHDQDAPTQSKDGDTSSYCCAAACAAAAFIFGAALLDEMQPAPPTAALPASVLPPVAASAIDPPPRLA